MGHNWSRPGTAIQSTFSLCLHGAVVMFPMDLLEKGLFADNFGMLGLGDIVVPGIYIALLCRFDFE